MTFNFAPWAIDGARTTAALARLATYASSGGKSGIVQPSDLRVLPLEVPGVGLRVLSGGATVMNHYLANTDQAYVVSNPSVHVVQAASMPAPAASTRHFLVCVVVGDSEYSASGHPFMPSTPIPPEQRADFEYVRVVLVPCPANTTRFEQLGLSYPAYALARVEIPPNTSTITSSMITDLRQIAQPRSERKVFMNTLLANEALDGAPYTPEDWFAYQPVVDVPPWATYVTITATMSGIVAFGSTIGDVALMAGDIMGAALGYDVDVPVGGDGTRNTMILALGANCAAYAGGSMKLKVRGSRWQGTGYLTSHDGTMAQLVYDVQFSETPV